jgi:hypothetical protein
VRAIGDGFGRVLRIAWRTRRIATGNPSTIMGEANNNMCCHRLSTHHSGTKETAMANSSNMSGQFSLGTALIESLRYAIPGIGHVLKISWWLLLLFVVAIAVIVAILASIFGLDELVQRDEYPAGRILFELSNGVLGLLFGSALLVVFARDYILQESPPRLLPVLWPVALRAFLFTITLTIAVFVLTFAITLLAILLGATLGASGGIAGFIAGVLGAIAFVYLICRFITWVVSRAVDQPHTLGEAWRATAGSTAWKILAGLVIIVILSIAVAFVIALLAPFGGYVLDQMPALVAIPIAVIVGMALLVIYVMFIALVTIYPAAIFKQIA